MTFLLDFDPFGPAVSPVLLFAAAVAGWLYLRGRARPGRLRPHAILLGSLTTLKEVVLYGTPGPRGGLSAMADETIGGYTIWVPSSMAMIVALILGLDGWNRAEERRWNARHALMRRSNSAALEFPETAAELRLKVAKPNRDVARTLALGTLAMFVTVIVTTITVLAVR